MSKFKVGDRVRVNKEDANSHGKKGTVARVPWHGTTVYRIDFDDVLVDCQNWSERYLEPAPLEVGELVEVKGYGNSWDGAVGKVRSSDAHRVTINLVQKYKEFDIGTTLTFSSDHLVRTSIPIEEETPVEKPKSKQELALTAAYHTFKFYQSQHEAKGKGQKARANELLANMMKEALDDFE